MTAGEASDHPVLLFDGLCNLCTWSVRFVVERDPEGVFRFAPLQSAVAEDLLAGHDLSGVDSVVLVEDSEVYTQSDAALRVATRLGGGYRLLGPFRYLPRSLRDAVYDLVASNRNRLFGTREQCMVPTESLEERFLGGEPTDSAGTASSRER